MPTSTADAPALDPYTQLAQLCGATGPVTVGTTQLGRGLVLESDMPAREALLTVPLHNALIIADEPTDGISIFSDKQHIRWQELHGELPPLLLEFLQGEQQQGQQQWQQPNSLFTTHPHTQWLVVRALGTTLPSQASLAQHTLI